MGNTANRQRESDSDEQTSMIQSADISQSDVITTTGTNADNCSENDDGPIMEESKILLHPKRQRKVVPAYEPYLSERRVDGRNVSNVKSTRKLNSDVSAVSGKNYL